MNRTTPMNSCLPGECRACDGVFVPGKGPPENRILALTETVPGPR